MPKAVVSQLLTVQVNLRGEDFDVVSTFRRQTVDVAEDDDGVAGRRHHGRALHHLRESKAEIDQESMESIGWIKGNTLILENKKLVNKK